MYLAYVKNIPNEEKVDDIVFTMRKSLLINHIVLLNESIKNKDVFILHNSNLLFHKNWLYCITEFTENSGIMCNNLERYIVKYDNGHFYDVEFGVRISENYKYYNNIDIINSETSSFITDKIINKCKHCNKEVHSISLNCELCIECFEKLKCVCGLCGKKYINYNFKMYDTTIGEQHICSSCISNISTCEKCNKYIIGDIYKVDGENFCYSCFNDKKDIVKCIDCGNLFSIDSKYIFKNKNDYICDMCSFNKRMENINEIREYTYKPEPNFLGNSNQRLFFGIELEMITPYSRRDKYKDKIAKYLQFNVNKTNDICYCKYDHSVGIEGMNGFEIVTHPMSWEWINSVEGIETINSILDVKRFGCSAFNNNTCGMHIHISKKAFTTKQLLNFLRFIYLNKDFSIMISDRTDLSKVDKYASFNVKENELPLMAERKININHQRHIAVNLNSDYTVELRIFRSTLDYNRFMKNVEFTKSVFEYSKISDEISLEIYKEYIKEFSNIYPHLNEFLIKKGEL